MIPKEFTINNRKYKVLKVESSEDELHNNLGEFSEILHEIKIAKSVKIDGEIIDISEDDLLFTFLHELGHCFGAYYKDDYSEEFACAFSHFMFDYLKSRK